jgi:hypothetical protein
MAKAPTPSTGLTDQPEASASAPAIAPVVAINWIDFKHLPDAIFTPDSQSQRDELFALEAVRELTDTEQTVYAAQQAAASAAADDVIG